MDLSRLVFVDLVANDLCVVVLGGLDTCLIEEVLNQLCTGFLCFLLHLLLLSHLGSVEILHINVMYPVTISRMSN